MSSLFSAIPSATPSPAPCSTGFPTACARPGIRSRRPIIGIAQTGSDLSSCNRHHMELAARVRDGIRDGGGVPFEFPVHPIQETGKRPTAMIDRNLVYLGLVEILHGDPFDGVVLAIGCDKTTPASLMAAATVDIPAVALSGGPMLDAYWEGRLAGSGLVEWEARKLLAAGKIDINGFIERSCQAATSAGHCNTMGTALTMNGLTEALGLSLSGCASIPAPHAHRRCLLTPAPPYRIERKTAVFPGFYSMCVSVPTPPHKEPTSLSGHDFSMFDASNRQRP